MTDSVDLMQFISADIMEQVETAGTITEYLEPLVKVCGKCAIGPCSFESAVL